MNDIPFDAMKPRSRATDDPPGGSRIKHYSVCLSGGKKMRTVMAECAGDAARAYVQFDKVLAGLAIEIGSIETFVTGPDTDGMEEYRIEAKGVVVFTCERLP